MECAICQAETSTNFCSECQQLMRRLLDCYTLQQVSRICTYVIGAKAVDEISTGIATKMAQDYLRLHMEEEMAQNRSVQ